VVELLNVRHGISSRRPSDSPSPLIAAARILRGQAPRSGTQIHDWQGGHHEHGFVVESPSRILQTAQV
jgi:hypothetical protein